MAITFTPTLARDLRRGDLLGIYAERVTLAVPCRLHPGGVYVEVEGFDEHWRYNGIASDICCEPDTVFIVRTTH